MELFFLRGLRAYTSVFDVTTLQTRSTNELHQFYKSRTHLGSLMTKLTFADIVEGTFFIVKYFISSVDDLRRLLGL